MKSTSNKKIMKRIMSALLALTMLVSMNCIPFTASAATYWTIATGTTIWVANTSDAENARKTPAITEYRVSLDDQIELFASELASVEGKAARQIYYGAQSEAAANDIIFVLNSASGSAAQGYSVTANGTQLIITASDTDGLYYGGHYVLQQLKQNSKTKVAVGVTESPAVRSRGISLDNGRKYFSVDWIKTLIKDMSWSNMNTLVLHFSEEMGLGIESKVYPWLNGRYGDLGTNAECETDNRQISQAELAEIIAFAKLYHVEIIPSLDSPGHMNYIVRKFEEKSKAGAFSFTFNGATYNVAKGKTIGSYYKYNGSGSYANNKVTGTRNTSYSRGIDISDSTAVAFAKSLVKEYADLFGANGCTKFDIGADEMLGYGSAIVSTSTASRWNQLEHWQAAAKTQSGLSTAVAYDLLMLYVNNMYEMVKGCGYSEVYMWNDDAYRTSDTGWTADSKHVLMNKNIGLLYWQPSTQKPSYYTDQGHDLINVNNQYCYYVLIPGARASTKTEYKNCDEKNIFNNWTPYVFKTASDSDYKLTDATDKAKVKGALIGVWCDNPDIRTEAQVWTELLPMIRSHAYKSWYASKNSKDYSTFTSMWTTIGDYPTSLTTSGDVYEVPNRTNLQSAVTKAEAVQNGTYSNATYSALVEAKNAGSAILTNWRTTKPSQADVNDATIAINSAYNVLAVDTSALEAAVAEYESLNPKRYEANSFAAYTSEYNAAKSVLNNANKTQTTVDSACNSLIAAKNALQLNTSIEDTDEYKAAVDKVTETANDDKYTPESALAYYNAVHNLIDEERDLCVTEDELNALIAKFPGYEYLLVEKTSVGDWNIVKTIGFTSSRVRSGGIAQICIGVEYDEAHQAYSACVYDEDGNLVELTKATITRKVTNGKKFVYLAFEVNEVGERSYTVYLYDKNGEQCNGGHEPQTIVCY